MVCLELLAPARDASTAREAILHGADAVYMGAPRFGARAAAGNSVRDIQSVVDFAHVYGVKVYVTLNTILFDDELDEVRQLAEELCRVGVDAFIVQDMALLEMHLPVALHASTQMDNRTVDKVRWLRDLGFRQVVLARELTLSEIRRIHEAVPEVALEAFVHGAICVSYNGQCYASQYCFGRSANRGECAQFCRLPFDLVDDEGRVVSDGRSGEPVRQRHLLSLRDMDRSESLEEMLDAGVTSFKIEGRMKDAAYVKNVTAYYRQRLDAVIRRRPTDFCRASQGEVTFDFVPQLDRTFNRGFSTYFLHGRQHNMVQLCSPKSTGQFVGHVKELRRGCFTVSSTVAFANGDGLCFVDAAGHLQGFRINRVEGNCLYPKEMPRGLAPRTRLYRNFDQAFTLQLARPTAQRRIPLQWTLAEDGSHPAREGAEGRLLLRAVCPDGVSVERSFTLPLSLARSPQQEHIERQLSRLGDTPFLSGGVEVRLSSPWFIPASLLAEWRRSVVEAMVEERLRQYRRPAPFVRPVSSSQTLSGEVLTYAANVSNHLSRQFYEEQGACHIDPAFELSHTASSQRVLMTMKYCPRHELGLCGQPLRPLFLRTSDGRLFPLRFDCRRCQVQVLEPETHA